MWSTWVFPLHTWYLENLHQIMTCFYPNLHLETKSSNLQLETKSSNLHLDTKSKQNNLRNWVSEKDPGRCQDKERLDWVSVGLKDSAVNFDGTQQCILRGHILLRASLRKGVAYLRKFTKSFHRPSHDWLTSNTIWPYTSPSFK